MFVFFCSFEKHKYSYDAQIIGLGDVFFYYAVPLQFLIEYCEMNNIDRLPIKIYGNFTYF